LLLQVCLDEYWHTLAIVSYGHDFLSLAVSRQGKVKRIVNRKWDFKVG
jgi:hypothetical protein